MYPDLSSPARKRQRLSSPTYDEQLGDLSQEDVVAFDKVDVGLSQGSQPYTRNSQGSSQQTRLRMSSQQARDARARVIEDALKEASPGTEHSKTYITSEALDIKDNTPDFDPFTGPQHDPNSPFTMLANASAFTSASTVKETQGSSSLSSDETNASTELFSSDIPPFTVLDTPGFASAFQLGSTLLARPQTHDRTPSPETVEEKDYSSWFESNPIPPDTTGFQLANFAPASAVLSVSSETRSVNKSLDIGWIAPSTSALEKAVEKFRAWQAEEPELQEQQPFQPNAIVVSTKPVSPLPISPRPVLHSVQNAYSLSQAPDSPSPAGNGFERPLVVGKPTSKFDVKGKGQARPFKSPLLNSSVPHTFRSPAKGSPLNPYRSTPNGFSSATSQHPLASAPLMITPARKPPSLTDSFFTPQRPLGLTPRIGLVTPQKRVFRTPFKAGMGPGEAGRAGLDKQVNYKKALDGCLTQEKVPVQAATSAVGKAQGKQRLKVFNLEKPPNRRTLASSSLFPQMYSAEELESMGINVTELSQITPNLALYYSFHTSSSTPLDMTQQLPVAALLGPAAALEQLLAKECSLATKPWVDNHWALILWKLAGMVSLDPEQESGPNTKRWCWAEVMRQLLYRYERELNSGVRPPLRLVVTRDAPASCPMVLCVSNVTWSQRGITDDGLPIEPHPELELTDGWYRMRAQVDEPLARAVRRGIIKIGRKLTVAGARLSSERKEPGEILESYNSTKLVLSGNSSHLASWHAKLGFQYGPYIATLNKLTPDGGLVAVMDVTIEKTYPLAFLEFVEDEDGKKRSIGPRGEKEESEVSEQWKRSWEIEESKLRSAKQKRWYKIEGYADRLEQKAGTRFRPGENDSPPHVENLYDELESATDAGPIFAQLTHDDAGWLARFIRENVDKERERAGEEIERELQHICPPREVRNFRILVVRDANTHRRPANRVAQLVVWDVLGLSLSEDSRAGVFELGQRFLVTNLLPTQQSAWMDREPDSEVYLSTRRDSRWTQIR